MYLTQLIIESLQMILCKQIACYNVPFFAAELVRAVILMYLQSKSLLF